MTDPVPVRSRPGDPRRIRRVGADGLLVECVDAVEAAALAGWILQHVDPVPVDVVPAASTVLAVATSGGLGALRAALSGAPTSVELAGLEPLSSTAIDLRVRYDGPDLAATAASLGCSPEALARAHAASSWRVDFIGFAPGFGYCSARDWPHRIPRLETPRERVPAGAVAIADGWSAVYPRASPGGWRLIGTTDAVLWDETSPSPARLSPGTTVRFIERSDPA